MADLSFSAASGLHPSEDEMYTMTDAEWDKVIAAYQSDANVHVNGTATYSDVVAYIYDHVFVEVLEAKVLSYETALLQAQTPPPEGIDIKSSGLKQGAAVA